ncbi:Dolichyl-diphosphooligosaccharide--protein glycosyltransferase subunit 2 [Citrus sinensis]|uniref:Dolichyl-diphosphooligosaccharide--protein glycosyltransferase subunit 2 n=1 Tax=Citrus sinensis TaxID=2711 RepID=A0ACB8MIB6_CITSI|nr:Dolichyl-diphosphooligosaccharide--protein glycosyltransferase subunit 2 [Citrus sinensis]
MHLKKNRTIFSRRLDSPVVATNGGSVIKAKSRWQIGPHGTRSFSFIAVERLALPAHTLSPRSRSLATLTDDPHQLFKYDLNPDVSQVLFFWISISALLTSLDGKCYYRNGQESITISGAYFGDFDLPRRWDLPSDFRLSPICCSRPFQTRGRILRQISSFLLLFNFSLEEAYEALRTFEVLGIEKTAELSKAICKSVLGTLESSSSTPKDLFHALGVNGILKCSSKEETFEGIISSLQAVVRDANSLLDFYYSIGSLRLIKDQTSKTDLHLSDAEGTFRSIKALSQSDGRWRYSSNNPESSTFAAGIALEALSGVVSLASSEIDQFMIGAVKNDIVKLFDSIEKYDDGTFYFDEKLVNMREQQGPLATTSSVVRGLTAFSSVITESLNLPGDKILGIAKFFLGIGIPGDTKNFFDQVDLLACLENNRQVKVNTVLGSHAPPLTVTLVRAFSSSARDNSIIENQELKFDPQDAVYFLDDLPASFDVGEYIFVFKMLVQDSEQQTVYATGTLTQVPIYVTGLIKIENAKIAVLDSDLGSVETQKKLDLAGESTVSVSANHLQKLRLSFQMSTPLGNAFKPHQDFLGLVEKFFYLSGRYDIQLTVGDAVMENSLLREIGYVELDLPEPPENASRPPPQPVDPYTRYGPKAEITHIFRAPEKRPPEELSLAFLVLTILPLFGFIIGLLRLGVNLKNFPTSAVPATFAVIFHLGIAAVLLLYVLFWLKLDLFTTLKTLCFLGVFLMVVGHRTLSHLASASAKLKSA